MKLFSVVKVKSGNFIFGEGNLKILQEVRVFAIGY